MKMYDSISKRVKFLQEKNGINYATTEGKLYKTLKVFFILFFSYAMVIKSFYFLGALVTRLQLDIVTPGICTALLIAGFVLVLFRKQLIGSILTTGSSVVLILSFSRVLVDSLTNKLLPKFYWAHLIPLCLLVLLAVWMTVIAIRAKLLFKKMYDKVAENIYNTYKVNVAKGEEIEEEKWEEFLENFDPHRYNDQFRVNEEASE